MQVVNETQQRWKDALFSLPGCVYTKDLSQAPASLEGGGGGEQGQQQQPQRNCIKYIKIARRRRW